MIGPESRRPSSHGGIDREDPDSGGGEERVDLALPPEPERPDQGLGVHGGPEYYVTLSEMRLKTGNGTLMMSVAVIEEADQDVGVWRYRSHSSRSSSRYPDG